ncbi:MAG: copper resistance protein B [Rhodothermales bacterium]|nr:copper resistance protein B [Rhodothermales bacterium]MBO6780098.1 copper resistance protein B [Rhodothermales bacterium]
MRQIALLLLLAAVPAAAAQHMDRMVRSFVQLDELEFVGADWGQPFQWSSHAWVGNQYQRLWLKAHQDGATSHEASEVEVQALYGRIVSPFWDAQIGVRLDAERDGDAIETRAHLAVGFEGMAPYWFELEPTLYISQSGDMSAQLHVAYDLFVTQRAVLELGGGAVASAAAIPEHAVGRGLNSVSASTRLRFELERKVAPYVGWRWARSYGATADFAREDGHPDSRRALVFGLRIWR